MMLFGWVPHDPSVDTMPVLGAMGSALRVHENQTFAAWSEPGLGIGVFRLPRLDHEEAYPLEPVVDAAQRFVLWMAGEAFAWPGEPLTGATESQQPRFRARLLRRLIDEGPTALSELDGEYQIALWDRADRRLALFVDRFAAVPLYWNSSREGFAFGGGVRGVLLAPGVDVRPDPEAIRQAVTFGGFRLASRTNVADVHMAPPAAAIVRHRQETRIERYWSWSDAPAPVDMPHDERLAGTRHAWRVAMQARLENSRRPGLTLSGGLDSRAILAEASRQAGSVSAVTYGVPQCDDVRFARRAARAANARWELFPLYSDGWLERRLSHVLPTDGLVELVDLMHMEVLPRLADVMDVYLSGYIGDLVSGGTYLDVQTVDDVLATLPYYGGSLALGADDVAALAEEALGQVGSRGHFVLYEHKLPQSTNRITAAARPWVRVRRPFVDYRFWRQAYSVPLALRRAHRWHEDWLRGTYPELFARIPNQRTSVPPGSSRVRHQVTRAVRFAWRRTLEVAAKAQIPVLPPARTYHPDWSAWRVPAVRDLITSTILRPGSIAGEIFGRHRVESTLVEFFERDAVPIQVIGALFTYEHYHRELPAALRQARRDNREEGPAVLLTVQAARQGGHR